MVYAQQGCQLLLFPGTAEFCYLACSLSFTLHPLSAQQKDTDTCSLNARIDILRNFPPISFTAAFNMTTGPVHWELLAKARAIDNQIFVALCSPARNPPGQGYQVCVYVCMCVRACPYVPHWLFIAVLYCPVLCQCAVLQH